ncbi:ABC transporter permease [Paenibacillus yonginensis]|uniref:ABC transporter permease n=1 Tax=Paenibacillus yonginensis TaxID=1462996 RepID=A0A1B1N5Z5_9BACL|nr:ABC transporter permease [Paenibacillus yonginensis]ANS76846.1 ABC transporter permease [Paenibacillus yonginensis]
MNKLGTVIRFSFMSKIRKKSFLITMLVIAILITILANVPFLIDKFMNKDDKPLNIGLVYEPQPAIAEKFRQVSEQLQSPGYTLVDYKGEVKDEQLQQDITSKKLDAYLKFSQDRSGGFPEVTYVSKSGDNPGQGLSASLQSALQTVKMQTIAGGSLSDSQLAELASPVQLNAEKAGSANTAGGDQDGKSSDSAKVANYIYVYVLIILFLMINTTTGSMIASEVTAEKSSRIMEILITSVSPLVQMFGKIIAMFLLGLMQIVFFAVVVVANISMPHNREAIKGLGVDISQISADVFLYGLVFYILGYFLYATLFAAIGSLVSRTEELGQAIMPITLLLMVSFYIGIFSIATPNTMLIKIASFIPFTSPISMLVRVGVGEVATWEIAVSLVILLIATFFFGWLSAKIYRTGVLLYGKRPSLKELGKAMRAYKM